jgi:hypothetical protein
MNIQALQTPRTLNPIAPGIDPRQRNARRLPFRSAVARLFGVSGLDRHAVGPDRPAQDDPHSGGHYRFPEEETRRAAKAGVTPE